jgi:hypothetical protein
MVVLVRFAAEEPEGLADGTALAYLTLAANLTLAVMHGYSSQQ